MKAIQYHTTFNNLTEAQEEFTTYSTLDGFLGGRVYQDIWTGYSSFAVQVFFDCDQSLPYGELYKGAPERVCLIMDSQALAVGIGNPYSQVAPQCMIESKPTENTPEEAELTEVERKQLEQKHDELTRVWLEASEQTRQAWKLARETNDYSTFLKLQKISHAANESATGLLHLLVYGKQGKRKIA